MILCCPRAIKAEGILQRNKLALPERHGGTNFEKQMATNTITMVGRVGHLPQVENQKGHILE